MAENDLISALMQIYGEGYKNPALENYRADPHNELGSQYTTQDTLGHMAQRSAPSSLLNALADYIPANQEHSVSIANMLRGGLGSAANWLDWKPETSDMLSPPGMGFLRGAGAAHLPNEIPIRAALKLGDKVYEGYNHGLAFSNAERALGSDAFWGQWNKKTGFGADAEGFVTNRGRYVTRQEATDLLGKHKEYPGELHAGSLNDIRRNKPDLFE